MKQFVLLGTFSVANIGIAFLFQWYVLTQLGPGMETDALFAGMTLPQLVLAVINVSLMHVLVPLLAGEDENQLRHDAWGFLVLVGGLFTLLASVFYVAAPWWVPLSVLGFNETGKALTVELTRIQLIGMVFTAINGVQWATYHARQQFVWADFTPILASIFSLLMLIWALPRFGVIAAAWISTMRITLQTLLLAPGMGKPVWPDLRSPALGVAWQRVKPLLLGSFFYKADTLVDRFMLSSANSGSLSLYYLAQQIYGAVNQVVNKALAAPLMPLLSKLHKEDDIRGFQRICRQRLLQVATISLAGLLLLGLLGQDMLELLIGHGNVTISNVKELWWIMIWLSGVFVGGLLGQICAISFYASGDTTTPMRMTAIPYALYIPSKIATFYYWGVMGLAIATSVYYMIMLSLHFYWLRRKKLLW